MDKKLKKIIEFAIDNYYNSTGIVYNSELITAKSSIFLPRVKGEFVSEEVSIRIIKEHTVFKLFSKNKKINSHIRIHIKKEFTFISESAQYKTYEGYDKTLYSKLEKLFKFDSIKQRKKDELRKYNLFK